MVDDGAAEGPPSRVDWVVAKLREGILAGDFPPDKQLLAKNLAGEWGVSQTPVREAFVRLAAQGFLQHSAHRGVRVSSITADEFTELYDLRMELEPSALRRAVEVGGVDWIGHVRTTWSALERATIDRDAPPPDEPRLHREWHFALISAAGESWWPSTVRLLRDQCERYWVLSLRRRPLAETHEEHRAIQEAVEAGAADVAGELLRRHIAVSASYVREQLGLSDRWASTAPARSSRE